MMDEFPIVNEAKEKLCYVSTDFRGEMAEARTERVGFRSYDRDFALPDFSDTFEGEVRLPAPLLRKREREEAMAKKAAAEEAAAKAEVMDVDESREGEGAQKDPGDTDGVDQPRTTEEEKEEGEDGPGDVDEAVDSDEETDEQRRSRILRQREEERRRREAEEGERQVLSLSVERFAVPEALFRPADVGLDQGGVAEAISQAIEACNPIYRAAMYHNILLVGGNALLPGYRKRLEEELRSLAP
eukprot:CAMPEP_0183321788 /NCGR_PEP_ID=MMETSP0160_2-20130417/69858_1 /TAXON_ID=2839 ORGANISM="Odontella Sinensis, Strain Grunow 1884" /NCGR_SAMPLE_ID=MMETSP0160_2 /ASSEMBLY_ACC=CAM_ASM_000250 /LENGTH=242 /DNA_ID=CAMNT_0025488807 /DNA_START=69 /DNA_END=794 /DNA_ORIENTATION=-